MANMYPCQALPGSPMYQEAKNGYQLPQNYEGYAFLSYESQPLLTKYLTAAEALQFSNAAWQTSFMHKPYLELVEKRFGLQERLNIEKMTQISLKRKIIGH